MSATEQQCLNLKVGSRKSQLALIQTNFVVDKLRAIHPHITFEIISMSTIGDVVLDRALSKIGEKSLFTKELEIALEQKVVDFVVHSLKDLPTSLPDGMTVAAILERDDPRDAVVFHPQCQNKSLQNLAADSVIGTSSLRRVAQLKRKFPHLRFENIRGNLNTRLKKLDDDTHYAAIVLARAGLVRMGWLHRIDQVLDPLEECMYAVGQGALGVECRADDTDTVRLLSSLNHSQTLLRCVAERAFLKTLEGGCTVPIAAHTILETNNDQLCLSMTGGVFSLDGSEAVISSIRECLHDNQQGELGDFNIRYACIVGVNVSQRCLVGAQSAGQRLAADLLRRGAKALLDQAKLEHTIEQERLKTQHTKELPNQSNSESPLL